MRVSETILTKLALLLGFYQAPFAHIHADDSDHPVSSTIIQWHVHHDVPSSAPSLIGMPTADDDAIDVGWNALSAPLGYWQGLRTAFPQTLKL